MEHSTNKIDELLKKILLKLASDRLKAQGIENPDVGTDPNRIEEDSVIVCARAKDVAGIPEPWQDERLHSKPRGVVCSKCGEEVTMSQVLWEHYEKDPKPEQIQCGHCVFKL